MNFMLYKLSLSKAVKTEFEDARMSEDTRFQHAHERGKWMSQIVVQYLINVMTCFGIGN